MKFATFASANYNACLDQQHNNTLSDGKKPDSASRCRKGSKSGNTVKLAKQTTIKTPKNKGLN